MCGSLALVSGNACLCEISLYSTQTHSKRLISQVDRLMTDTGLLWPQISAIAVSVGPGSFTGLRIALSTAKGLAMAFSKPLLAVPTLDGLASQIRHVSLPICPIMDARKKEVYSAFYRCDSLGTPTRCSEYMAISPEKLLAAISEPTIFVGDGINVYGDVIRETLADLALFSPPFLHFTRASAIGMLALEQFHNNAFIDPASATPLYVRASDAELNFIGKRPA